MIWNCFILYLYYISIKLRSLQLIIGEISSLAAKDISVGRTGSVT